MIAKPLLVGLSALLLLAIPCSRAVGQAAGSTTETQWDEEVDVHVQLASQWRVLAFAGSLQQGQNYPFRQWNAAAGLGYQSYET